MLDLVIPYFVSVLITTIVLIAALITFISCRSKAGQYALRMSRLPLATEWDDLEVKLPQRRSEYEQLAGDLSTARQIVSRRKEAEDWLQTHETDYLQKKSDLPSLQARAAQLTSEVRDAESNRSQLSAELQRISAFLASEKAQYERLKTDMEDAVTELDGYHTRILQRTEEEVQLQVRVAENKARLDEVLVSLKTAEASLKDVRDKLDRDRLEAGTLRASVLENLQRESDLAKRCQELSGQEASIQQRLEVLSDVLAKFKSEHSDLETKVTQLREQKEEQEAIQRELNELVRVTRDDYDKESRELDGVRSQHQRLQSEIQEMKLHYNALQQRIAESAKLVPSVNSSDEEKIAELWSPVLPNLSASRGSFAGAENDALSRAGEYLRGLGLHFPDRVLKAFHTTLKVADLSPLVVLAGISGTGKSLLPRRYAEAMGMHFLNIPVQPRWDSPQDMFGFYNYLENRYRSTELARALIQMDRFAGEPGRGWRQPNDWKSTKSRADQMLIVLLDEMNLARVEYYFSEFLSRLETRRGINSSNPTERRKAEVALEIGMSQESQSKPQQDGGAVKAKHVDPAMHVFVDKNVLFVGTMNEDESTQTLSDKVVDRANVIRFGRPKQLDQKPITTSSKPFDTYMSFATWQKWTKNGDHVQSEVLSVIDTLNTAMTTIRRPFAYRTAQAIRTYVANYPDPAAYNNAMSDQIEFKILPRFRGIDLGDNVNKRALDDIRRVVDKDLNDKYLASAIEECIRQGQNDNQFSWNGLDRSGDA